MTTIDSVLQQIRQQLNLSTETEVEILEEIRTHFEDALDHGRSKGLSDDLALQEAAEAFGIQLTVEGLRDVHAEWESADAILACIIPTFAALILRWLAFAPNGSAIGWQNWLLTPAFWVVALVCLLIPIIRFNQWHYAMVSWGIFWFFTVIFIALPNIQSW